MWLPYFCLSAAMAGGLLSLVTADTISIPLIISNLKKKQNMIYHYVLFCLIQLQFCLHVCVLITFLLGQQLVSLTRGQCQQQGLGQIGSSYGAGTPGQAAAIFSSTFYHHLATWQKYDFLNKPKQHFPITNAWMQSSTS